MDRYKLSEGLILTEDTEDLSEKDGPNIIVKPVWKVAGVST
ncbi:putative AAA+ superfamily ATPase [Methanolobus bombayensis]|jgi:predicted AAA+ superfamily ATPase|nr:putative AAA+ superfamily ATPase [Methanolobus bombayensis]